jgi:hypothetical protein
MVCTAFYSENDSPKKQKPKMEWKKRVRDLLISPFNLNRKYLIQRLMMSPLTHIGDSFSDNTHTHILSLLFPGFSLSMFFLNIE